METILRFFYQELYAAQNMLVAKKRRSALGEVSEDDDEDDDGNVAPKAVDPRLPENQPHGFDAVETAAEKIWRIFGISHKPDRRTKDCEAT